MNELNLIDLTPLLEGVISLLMILVTVYLIPALKRMLTNAQLDGLRSAVHIAVYAAEKIYGGGKGTQKLEYAEQYIREHYRAKVDTKALLAMIDAEIKDMELKDLTVVVDGAPALAEDEETEEDEEAQSPPGAEV